MDRREVTARKPYSNPAPAGLALLQYPHLQLPLTPACGTRTAARVPRVLYGSTRGIRSRHPPPSKKSLRVQTNHLVFVQAAVGVCPKGGVSAAESLTARACSVEDNRAAGSACSEPGAASGPVKTAEVIRMLLNWQCNEAQRFPLMYGLLCSRAQLTAPQCLSVVRIRLIPCTSLRL